MTDLIVKFIDGHWWQVHHDFELAGHTVPEGFQTDFASILRLFWRVLPPAGPWAKAAVLHDYLYRNGIGTRAEADLLFYHCMEQDNVPWWQRVVIYRAVRLFGGQYYASANSSGAN